MRIRIVFYLLLLESSVFPKMVSGIFRHVSPSVVRFISFEVTRKGQRFKGTGIESHQLPSSQACAMQCMKRAECRSYNFCGMRNCQLNSDDVYSTIPGDDMITDDPDCVYVEMREEFEPSCKERDEMVNIQIDDSKSNCDIFSKKVNMQWGEWNSGGKSRNYT